MRKNSVKIIIVICLVAFAVIVGAAVKHLTGNLSISYVENLISEKGRENITWDDFSEFSHADIGSGYFVYEYDLPGGEHLYLSGGDLSAPPENIYSIDKNGKRTDFD